MNCERGRKRATYDPERQRSWHVKKNYGVSETHIQETLAAQGGRCAICAGSITRTRGAPACDMAVVDHCHVTGTFRAVLCGLCNTGLGSFRDDSERLRRATAYLLAHEAATESERRCIEEAEEARVEAHERRQQERKVKRRAARDAEEALRGARKADFALAVEREIADNTEVIERLLHGVSE